MKNLNLGFIALTLFVFLNTNAQITKGNWMVGGSAYFSTAESTSISNNIESKTKSTGFSINPDLGYFIADKFCIGSSIGFSASNPKGPNNNSSAVGIGPFIRYYFLPTEKTINIFANAGYGYSKTFSQNGYSNYSNGYSISAGPVIYFNSSVGLEMTLNYNSYKNNSNSKFTELFFGLGFQIHLEKK